jgi:hypothetical protein
MLSLPTRECLLTAVLSALLLTTVFSQTSSRPVGAPCQLLALAENGRSDVIFTMNNQSDKPGYGMQLARGATSLTEAWDGLRKFYQGLGGIRPNPAGYGFKKIITATVWVPTYDAAHILAGDRPAGQAVGVRYLRTEGNAAVFVIGSGTYRFTSQLPR